MRSFGKCLIISLTFALGAAPAAAASFTATSANLSSVFAAAGAGDTIVLSGRFGTSLLANRSFARPLTINAKSAVFSGTMSIRNVNGLVFSGGRFGSSTSTWLAGGALNVSGGSNIRLLQQTVIGDGAGTGRGISIRNTNGVTIDRGSFTGLRMAIGVNSIRNGVLSNNTITRATSDGLNIVNSHFVTANNNTCSGTIPSLLAHPDCIQLWSLLGQPVQSDISILNNFAYGATQGFTSFDAARGGGLRIVMSGNRVDTLYPQGIACYGCVDSTFTNNVLTTMPEANHRTFMRIIGGSNNLIANNSIAPFTAMTTASTASTALSEASISNEITSATQAFGAVPEPMVWGQMLAGLALVGSTLRRRQRMAV